MTMAHDMGMRKRLGAHSIDVVLARALLMVCLDELRKFRPHINRTDGWVSKVGPDHWEFHGPAEFYWHGRADNAYEARWRGWLEWLDEQAWQGAVEGAS
jgi:hypothetical protein